ncbi:MAG: hypothetical protein K6T90_03905 [Leptolyngbyaceae cyanobacterium HOT.MB2.61]|jgi:hypothetical protein|nr:hypothetical protein [Leptolyngbyaceae cyanobacterium HOT.MB2.61]
MYAYQLPEPNPKFTRRPRRVPRTTPRKRSNPYRAIALETGIKLAVNMVLSAVAITALVKLLPYRAAQEAKLKELDVAVESTNRRVGQVQASFKQYFDPAQARALMQQTTNRIDPSQRQIILQPPAN